MSDTESQSNCSSDECVEGNEIVSSHSSETPDGDDTGSLSTKLYFGNVSVQDSTDVQFGNRVYYNGPITIKQYIKVQAEGDIPSITPRNRPCINDSTKPAPSDTGNRDFTKKFVKRGDWFAMPVRGKLTPLEKFPLEYVVICHSCGSTYTDPVATRNALRSIQASCFKRGMYDICYNFLVGADGFIYEGRGWDMQAATAKLIESKCVSVGYIGDFMFELPCEQQVEAMSLLLEEGVRIGKLSPNYKLFAHKQVHNTESPGMAFIEEIRKWPHWAPFEGLE